MHSQRGATATQSLDDLQEIVLRSLVMKIAGSPVSHKEGAEGYPRSQPTGPGSRTGGLLARVACSRS
jgi:hypothetical protein